MGAILAIPAVSYYNRCIHRKRKEESGAGRPRAIGGNAVQTSLNDIILRFFRDDIGGILITGAEGEILYSDEKSAFVQQEKTNWRIACPPPQKGQKNELWDLLRPARGETYMVSTSTFQEGDAALQIHQLIGTSVYMGLYRDMTDYSKTLKDEKEHDGLTGLFNKGKFLQLKQTLFPKLDSIVIFNMDVNNLKRMNDTCGHEAGDRLIKKAAASLHRIEARNVLAFRVGGDEFMAVGLHMSREEAENLRRAWEAGLAELNRQDDGIPCVIACGMAYGEKDYDLEALFRLADERMYEDKKAKKARETTDY